ncbi:MAG TPA: hypothetical protein VFP61_04585 [Acidimicrobiales bacterium]|nr:hypothetical protein [Acidimicrobiales bacterium]
MPTRVRLRLRIALADRPGALAAAAAAIAGQGGNIEAVDVLRRPGAPDGDQAVDDLTVSFAGPAPVAELRRDLAEGAAATLLSIQAASHRDPVVVVLDAAARLTALAAGGDPRALDEALAAAVAELCAAPVAWVERAGVAAPHPTAALAREQGGAVGAPATGLPGDGAERLGGDGWLVAVPDASGGTTGSVVLAARAGDPFTAVEVARIEGLMALAGV